MSYRRHSYDINKWHANEATRAPRSAPVRWALLLGLALALAMPVIALFDDGPRHVNLIGYLPLILAFARSPFGRDSWALDRRRTTFDEFERHTLARAARRAYVVLLALTAGCAAWMWAATAWQLPVRVTPLFWSACLHTVLCAGIALPVVFAEWMVPLPPASDTMED